MSIHNVLFTLLSGIVLALSLGAEILRSRGYLPSELMIATGLGILLGPVGFRVVLVPEVGPPMALLEELARITVAIAVMSIALELPETYVRERARSLLLLIGPGMVFMWLVSALLTYWLFPVSAAMALLVGSIVTPTDPVIATSIVQGQTAEENVPERIRHLLIGEAGANDSVAYLFVFFAIFLLGSAEGEAVVPWVLSTTGWDLLGAVAFGSVSGALVGRIERVLSGLDRLDETSVFAVAIALTFVVLGGAKLLGTDDILAVFVAGLAYNWQADPTDEEREQTAEELFNRLFTLPIFVVFGATIPWSEWMALGWRAPVLVAGILLLRRLPVVFLLERWLPPLDRPAGALFVGWFGPIGVAALFYATLASHRTGTELPWVLGSLAVAGSILGHGLTASAATHWYGSRGDTVDGW